MRRIGFDPPRPLGQPAVEPSPAYPGLLTRVLTATSFAVLLLSAGCADNSPGAGGPQEQAPISSHTPGTAEACPNPEGGSCLGQVSAGTYTTKVFMPTLTYTVPPDWWNYEDTPGNFLIVPPWGTLPGVNAGTSDYIGVYTHVAADSCADVPRTDVAPTVRAISRSLTHMKYMTSTRPRMVKIGGLKGTVQDLTVPRDAGDKACNNGLPGSPLIAGLPPSDLFHAVIPGMVLRLYLLQYNGGALAIEIDDLLSNQGANLNALTKVVRRVRFTP